MLARRLMGSVASGVSNPFTPFNDALYAVRHGTSPSLVDLVRVTWDGTTLTFGTPLGRTGMTRAIYGLPCRSSLNKVLILGRDYTTLGTDLQPVGIDPANVPAAAYGVHLPSTLTTSSSVSPGSVTYSVTNNNTKKTYTFGFGYGVESLADDAVTAGSYDLTTTGPAADPSSLLDASALYVQRQSVYAAYSTSPSGTTSYTASQDPFLNIKSPSTLVTGGDGTKYALSIKSAALTLDLGPLVTKASWAAYKWSSNGYGNPYKRTSTLDQTVTCAVTDTLGTLLVTAVGASSGAVTSLLVEDASTGKARTLSASISARFNTGDAMLYAGSDAVTLCTAPAPSNADAMAQSGSSYGGTLTYKVDPSLYLDVDLVPWLMALGQPSTPVYATGLPGNGQGVLFDAPRGAGTIGRVVRSTLPTLIGLRVFMR